MIKVILSVSIMFLLSAPVFAHRGCCSHHGGVASCGSDGYEQCNDGTESPSCTCDNYAKPDDTRVPKKLGNDLFSQNRPLNRYLTPALAEFLKVQS